MGKPVQIELTADEALVLFDFLSRYCETDVFSIVDQAEQRALWNLLGLFESQLVEPFCPEYLELLGAARDRLRNVVE